LAPDYANSATNNNRLMVSIHPALSTVLCIVVHLPPSHCFSVMPRMSLFAAAGAPAKKRQRVAPGNGSSAADSRPTVKIVCDCDRYRLSGLASAGLGRYVGYTVTKVGAGGDKDCVLRGGS
jgi:hypothetical protein